jgi:hypothetical protein
MPVKSHDSGEKQKLWRLRRVRWKRSDALTDVSTATARSCVVSQSLKIIVGMWQVGSGSVE